MVRLVTGGLLLLIASTLTQEHLIDAATAADSKEFYQRQEIRFYRANKQLQTDRLVLPRRKGKEAGCHNFIVSTRIYQANQIGFKQCQLFAKKDCAEGTELDLKRKKKDTTTKVMSQGYSWFPVDESPKGAKAKSWFCEG